MTTPCQLSDHVKMIDVENLGQVAAPQSGQGTKDPSETTIPRSTTECQEVSVYPFSA